MANIRDLIILSIIAVHLPLAVISMETKNGYLCNLCHSLQNDHPYPPPDAEDRIVRFTKSQNEKFGSPFDRGVTCLEVWNNVLDFANPNIKDETSCRDMAQAYASQCCNDITEESGDDLAEHHKDTVPLHNDVRLLVTRSINDRISDPAIGNGRKDATAEASSNTQPLQNEPSFVRKRISNPSMGAGRNDVTVTFDLFSATQPSPSERQRLSNSSMGTGRDSVNGGDDGDNGRRINSLRIRGLN